MAFCMGYKPIKHNTLESVFKNHHNSHRWSCNIQDLEWKNYSCREKVWDSDWLTQLSTKRLQIESIETLTDWFNCPDEQLFLNWFMKMKMHNACIAISSLGRLINIPSKSVQNRSVLAAVTRNEISVRTKKRPEQKLWTGCIGVLTI